MVNTSEFTKRLEKICEEHDLSSAALAEKIDVGRATISHIMSGRNKPSLDFVMKVVASFPDVDLYWLLNGKGSYPKKNVSGNDSLASKEITTPEKSVSSQHPESSSTTPEFEKNIKLAGNTAGIKRVVIFLDDGTFESYEP